MVNPLFEFTEEEDKFLTFCLFRFGYGQWELMRNEYRNCELFRLNWIAKARSIQDIQRRCDQLVARFKRENALAKEEEDAKKKKRPPRTSAKSSRKPSAEDDESDATVSVISEGAKKRRRSAKREAKEPLSQPATRKSARK